MILFVWRCASSQTQAWLSSLLQETMVRMNLVVSYMELFILRVVNHRQSRLALRTVLARTRAPTTALPPIAHAVRREDIGLIGMALIITTISSSPTSWHLAIN